MSTQPKVSILVVCYNHAKFLRQCLDSIIAQKTNHPFEVLIADDASTDGSQEIIKEYHARYPELITTVLLHKKSSKHLFEAFVLRAGLEPARTLLFTGF